MTVYYSDYPDGAGRVPRLFVVLRGVLKIVLRTRTARGLVHALLAVLVAAPAWAADNGAAALRAEHARLAPALAHSPFHRPLTLESTESSGQIRGDIHAIVDYPFATVNSAINNPAHWCDILILHLNTKYCHASADGSQLQVAVGKKYDQPLEDAYRLDFSYHPTHGDNEYFAIDLGADKGPLGTSNYRILLEAVALPDAKTFLHLTYSYSYSFLASVAMQGYLATAGSEKVGFTRVNSSGGSGNFIGGVRGIIERNTMRYYLAIDAYLAGLDSPPAAQLDKRLLSWFGATERYAQQLHEMDQNAYVAMKRVEYARQQAPAP